MLDVAVVGLGPAGRALASRCATRGLCVLGVDPRPETVWAPTYGLWADELGTLPLSVVRARADNPEVRVVGNHPLHRAYLILDNAATQAALPLDAVTLRRALLSDAEVAALRAEARIVVDARGPGPRTPDSRRPVAAQTAYGIVVPVQAALPALQEAEALLMDWTDDRAELSATGAASFLYAVPLGAGRMLLEETCLAAAPPMPIEELRHRLIRRLTHRGVERAVIDDPIDTEVVHIPMRGPGRPAISGVLAVGTAGRGGNPVTGYSVAHSLRTADRLAALLASGRVPSTVDSARTGGLVREVGLRALLRLNAPSTRELFDAFGRLAPAQQRAFMSRDSSARELLTAMWDMFVGMPPRAKADLVRATAGGTIA